MHDFEYNSLGYWLSSTLIGGYSLFVPLFLLLRILPRKRVQTESVNLLSATNFTFCIGLVLQICLLAALYLSRNEHKPHFAMPGPTNFTIYLDEVLVYLVGIFFLFRRFRKSWILSLIMLLLLKFDAILTLYLKLFRGYIPSAWEIYSPVPFYHYVLSVVIFATAFFLVYFFLAKRKKLPFSSAFIR